MTENEVLEAARTALWDIASLAGETRGEDEIRLARRMARIRRPADDAFKAIDTANEEAS